VSSELSYSSSPASRARTSSKSRICDATFIRFHPRRSRSRSLDYGNAAAIETGDNAYHAGWPTARRDDIAAHKGFEKADQPERERFVNVACSTAFFLVSADRDDRPLVPSLAFSSIKESRLLEAHPIRRAALRRGPISEMRLRWLYGASTAVALIIARKRDPRLGRSRFSPWYTSVLWLHRLWGPAHPLVVPIGS